MIREGSHVCMWCIFIFFLTHTGRSEPIYHGILSEKWDIFKTRRFFALIITFLLWICKLCSDSAHLSYFAIVTTIDYWNSINNSLITEKTDYCLQITCLTAVTSGHTWTRTTENYQNLMFFKYHEFGIPWHKDVIPWDSTLHREVSHVCLYLKANCVNPHSATFCQCPYYEMLA